MFDFLKIAKLLLQGILVSCESSRCFTSSPTFDIASLKNFFSSGCVVVSHYGYDLHFPNDVEHLVVSLSVVCVSSLEKCLFRSFIHF